MTYKYNPFTNNLDQVGVSSGPGSGIQFLDGDTGSATGTTVDVLATANCGYSVSFQASGAQLFLNVTDSALNTV